MKNRSRKAVLVLTLITAGSVFYGTTQAEARGLELDGIQITFGRHPDDAPPPPPHHQAHMPPPPPHSFHRRCEEPHMMMDRRGDFRPEPPRGHMPPPHR